MVLLGFSKLGSNLADYYLRKGFKVTGCDNLIGGDLENVDNEVASILDWLSGCRKHATAFAMSACPLNAVQTPREVGILVVSSDIF